MWLPRSFSKQRRLGVICRPPAAAMEKTMDSNMDHYREDAGQEQPPLPPPSRESAPVEVLVALAQRGAHRVSVTQADKSFADEFNLASATKREKFLKEVARRFDCDETALNRLDRQLIDAIEPAPGMAPVMSDSVNPNGDEVIAPAVPMEALTAAEEMLRNPSLVEQLRDDFGSIGIVGETLLCLIIYLVGTSRLLTKPLALCVQAASASGKSFTVSSVLSLFPETELLQATNMSPQSLFYLKPGSLTNKIVFVAERQHPGKNADETANAGLALREMISAGVLDKFVTARDKVEGLTTIHIKQTGPIAYIETTTVTDLFDEDANRMLFVSTDESEEQTCRIMNHQAAQAAGMTLAHDGVQAIKNKHHALQSLLRRKAVRVPFAGHIKLCSSHVTARRLFQQVLRVIESVALLRQFQKEEVEPDVIVADMVDYELAYELLTPILTSGGESLSEATLRVYEVAVKQTRAAVNGIGVILSRPIQLV
jgi:hypothetical protein